MHKSLLFRPKRCLFCTKKTSPESDVSLADPWLKEYIENDKIGNSIVIASSQLGIGAISNMRESNEIELKEIDESVYIKSQLGTIERKAKSCNHHRFNKIVSTMGKEGSVYKHLVTSSVFFLKTHNHLIKRLYKYI